MNGRKLLKITGNGIVVFLLALAVVYIFIYTERNKGGLSETAGQQTSEIAARGEASGLDETELIETESGETEAAAYDFTGYVDGVCLVMAGGGVSRQLALYLDGAEAYFFLPSCAGAYALSLMYDETEYALTLDGKTLAPGADVSSWNDGNTRELALSSPVDGETAVYALTLMQSENLPAVFIDTANGTMEYLNQSKSNREPGELLCLTADGSVDCGGSLSYIHARGSNSFSANKKSYKISFDTAQDVLGMEAGCGWVLAANAFDSTKIRNGLAYQLAQDMGLSYAVDYRYADVWFNGEYAGNYLICEPAEVEVNRIDIAGEDSYLLVREGVDRMTEEDLFFYDRYAGTYRFEYPKTVSEDTVADVGDWLCMVQDLIAACASRADYRALQAYVDTDSFAAMYLIDMLTDDIDSNTYSTYLYIDGATGLLSIGPAWDYDRAWGNAGVRAYIPQFNSYFNGIPEQLWELPYFQEEVQKKLLENEAAVDRLLENVEMFVDQMRTSIQMDALINSDNCISATGDYDTDVAYVEWYIRERTELTRESVNDPDAFHRVFINSAEVGRTYYIRDGETIPQEALDVIYSIYGCTGLAFESGVAYWQGCPILSDIVLHTTGGTSSAVQESEAAPAEAAATEERREDFQMGMTILSIIILLVPGLIACFISMDFSWKGGAPAALFARYAVCEFLVVLFTYGVIYLLKGVVTISLSGSMTDAAYTLYDANVVFLMMALELVGACAVGYAIRAAEKRRRG